MSYSDWGVALWKALVFGQRLNLMTPCPSMDFQYYVQSLLNQEVTNSLSSPCIHMYTVQSGRRTKNEAGMENEHNILL